VKRRATGAGEYEGGPADGFVASSDDWVRGGRVKDTEVVWLDQSHSC